MPYRSCRSLVFVETLESRRLLASIGPLAELPDLWGRNNRLIRQDVATERFPSITGAGQTVAILDTGIDYSNPFFGGGFGPGYRVVGGYDFVNDDPDPMDTYGHGTQVAGVIAAAPFEVDGQRSQGVAPGANIVALRIDAANEPVPDERIERALQWVIDHRAEFNIVSANISFGSGRYEDEHTSIYSDELAKLRSAGVLVVASSGNGGVGETFGVEYPAADPSVFSVGAVDQFDVITEYSERGTNLDLLAPGEDVQTISLGPDDFLTVGGTSYACAFVAGAVALMRQANPDLHIADIMSIFHAGSVENFDGDVEFGNVTNLMFQRLDLVNAVSLALARRPGPLGSTGEIATAGNGNDLAYDPDGVLHITYYDAIERTLKYVTRDTSGGVSTAQIIDPHDADLGGYVSLAVDSRSRPAVAYFDGSAGDLRYAHFNGETWSIETIDSQGSVGLYPSVTFDIDDRPVISYFHKTRGDLRVARFDGTAWNIQTVDANDVVGRSTDIVLNRNTGELAIAYEDSTRGRLKMARNPGSGWTRGLIDHSTLGVTHVSAAFAPDNQLAVSYYDIHNADLKYAEFDGVKWNHQRIASKGAQGLYTQLYFSASGDANIIYYNRRNNLVVRVFGGLSNWNADILKQGGGRYISTAIDPRDQHVTYTWFQPGVAKLRLGEIV